MVDSQFDSRLNPTPRQSIDFEASCAADEVYLLLKGPASSLLTQLERTSADHFAVTLALPPGAYRYRYYVNRDGVTTYAAPSDHATVSMHGFDGLLTVHAPRAQSMQLAPERPQQAANN